jgi:putative sporulation protein YtxC
VKVLCFYPLSTRAKLIIALSLSLIVISASIVYVQATSRIKPIYEVKTSEKVLALTFDISWGTQTPTPVLDILEENQVKATFFLSGPWAQKYPEIPRRIADNGHEVASHGQRHINLSTLQPDEIKQEIMQAHNILQEVTGTSPKLIRTPNGDYADHVIMARIVAELIITDWEKILLSKMIDHQKDLFTPVERKQILERAERFLELTDGIAGFGTSEKAGSSKGNSNRRNLIRQAVLEYLEANDELVIDGFLRFRLKHYLDQLSQAVDSAIDELMMEREYQEFIRLLRYFVEIQEPRANQVHVVMRPTGIFHIYDSHGHPVEHDYLNGFLLDVVETDLNYEDLLISALITIAPQQITIHLAEASQIGESVETIQEVFDGRVIVCPGCEHCLRYNKL